MGISDHWGKPKPFSTDCLVTENQESIAMLQFSDFSQRNKGPSFHNLTNVFINAFTLSLNCVSSWFFLNHIDK